MARAGGRDGMSRRTEVPWLPDRMLRAAIVAPWISAAIAVALTITAIWLGSDATGLTALVLGVVAGALAVVCGVSELPAELTRRVRYDADHTHRTDCPERVAPVLRWREGIDCERVGGES